MKRVITMCLWLVMVQFMAKTSLADVSTILIKGDSTWRASTDFVDGWQNATFDDSTWLNATSPAPNNCGWETVPILLPGVSVNSMWSKDGNYGVYFRKSFNLQDTPIVDSATIYSVADDDHEIYVNGIKVASEYTGTAGPILTTDIKSYLQSGNNIIAIYAQDTSRGCQWLGVIAKITFSGRLVISSISVPDLNGNNAPEEATLFYDQTTTAMKVSIRDSVTKVLIKTIDYGMNNDVPLGLAVVPDINRSGKHEIAVLFRESATNKALVAIRDSITGVLIKRINFGTFGTQNAKSIMALEDTDGNGVPEIAVTTFFPANGKYLMVIRDAASGVLLRSITVP